MRIYFDFGPNSKIDATRGIGANSDLLIRELRDLLGDKIQIVDNPANADIVHIAKFNPFFRSLPFFKPAGKVILTIHDLIPLIYPEHYPPGIRGSINFLINKFLIRKNVDAVITISETSKKDIVRFLGVSPEFVNVIYIAPKKIIRKLKTGPWKNEIRKRMGLPEKFAFFDHGVNYNKNVPNLVMACRKAGIPLVMIGKETENIGRLNLSHPELSHLRGVDFSDVIRLGYVNDEDLNRLFNLADVYVQPSFYEGFCMPVLEAMSVGCPVVASKTQALTEIAGGACLFADPENYEDMAKKINEVINNKTLRNQLIETGKILVKNFNWEKTARETFKVYSMRNV